MAARSSRPTAPCGSHRTKVRISSGSARSTRARGRFTPRSPEKKWDVDSFDIAEDGSFIAYVVNEAGNSRLRIMDPKTGAVRNVDGLPSGVMGGVEIAPWGTIGLTFTSATSAADAYAVDPATLKVTRWTRSETGGLDAGVNIEPELVEVKSFDKRAGIGLPLPPRCEEIPRQAAADRQHPWRAGGAIDARLPRPQQLSAERAGHRHLLPQCPRIDRLRQALRQPRQRARQARGFGEGHRRVPRCARQGQGRRSASGSR